MDGKDGLPSEICPGQGAVGIIRYIALDWFMYARDLALKELAEAE